MFDPPRWVPGHEYTQTAMQDSQPPQMKPPRGLAAGLLTALSMDLRSLAAFRIGLGVLLLVDLAHRLPDLAVHYTEAGLLPRAVLFELSTVPVLSLHALSTAPWVQALLFAGAALSALGLLLGYRTRWATVASWLLLLSLHARNPLVLNSGDRILLLLLMWGLLLPLGARWSVDAHRARRAGRGAEAGPVLSMATMGLLLQLVLIYFLSVFYKTEAPWRVDFTAVYYALNLEAFATPLGQLLASAPLPFLQALTVSTLALEGLGPLLLLVTAWGGRVRIAVALAFIGFHLGLAATLNLGIFPFVCATAWVAVLPSRFWDWMAPDRVPAALVPRPMLGTAGTVVAALLIVASLGESAQQSLSVVLGPADDASKPAVMRWPRAVGIFQHWDMFAPRPTTYDVWYAFVGVRTDSTRVNVFPESGWPVFDEPDPFAKPALASRLYPNQRWRKFLMENYPSDAYEAHRDRLTTYLWQRWHATHPDQPLVRIDVEQFLEVTPPPGLPKTVQHERLLAYLGPQPSTPLASHSEQAAVPPELLPTP
ncbi:MAG: HTTM domain-containing protein [Bacteroidota bacterium]